MAMQRAMHLPFSLQQRKPHKGISAAIEIAANGAELATYCCLKIRTLGRGVSAKATFPLPGCFRRAKGPFLGFKCYEFSGAVLAAFR
jgi:hypothetical protein